MSFEEASRAADQAGLVLIRDRFDQTSTQPANTIIGQDPASGAVVDRGSEVKLTLAAPAAAVLVPDLRNQPWQTADTLIVQAGLAIGERTDEFDALVPAGSIVSQDPRPLLAVPPQTPINYVVSKGPEPSPTFSPTTAPTTPPTSAPTLAPTPTATLAPTASPPPPPPPPDASPSIINHTPEADATEVPIDSEITITFSEPVTLSAGWFLISCGTPGDEQPAQDSGGPTTWTLTPDASLPGNETCTVTVTGTKVTDRDGSPDRMTRDVEWSFKTGK
jgi:beta-lactam-binding protein with PASTA domain